MSVFCRLARLGARLGTGDDGNVLVMTAFASAALCASLAFAIDYGSIYYAKRNLQAATDMAAMAGAQAQANAAAVARESLGRNGFAAPRELAVEVGNYTASRDVAVGSRFSAGALPQNAVRVAVAAQSPLYFGRVLSGRESVELRATAVAARSQFASFSIGARIVSVEGALANAILSRIFGNAVALSAGDYAALADARVDIFQLSRALATRLDRQGATYGQLAVAAMSVGDVYQAIVTIGRGGALGNDSLAAMENLGAVPGADGVPLELAKVVGFGPYRAQAVTDAPSASVSVGLMDLVMVAAMTGNGSRQIAVDLGTAIAGTAGSKATVAVGDRTPDQPWLTLGEQGATARTAPVRLLLETTIAGIDGLDGRKLALPIYVDIAASEARLASLSCGRDGVAGMSVTLGVTPGPARLQIGSATPASLGSFLADPAVAPAAMISEAAITVSGSARMTAGSASESGVVFDQAAIDGLSPKTVAADTPTTTPATGLAGRLSLDIQLNGFGADPDRVRSSLRASLAPALTPLDKAIDGLLELAGVRIGQIDVVVNGLRCDGAVLVQ